MIRNGTRLDVPRPLNKPVSANKGNSTIAIADASSLKSRAAAAAVSTTVSPAQTNPPAAKDGTFSIQNVSPIEQSRSVGASRDQASELSHPVTDNDLPSEETDLIATNTVSSKATARRNPAHVYIWDNSFAVLRLDEYWTHKEWSRISEGSVLTIQDIWDCLGVSNPDAHTPLLTALRVEIRAIAVRIRTHLDPEELLWCAADTKYLDEEILMLLNEYASRLWCPDAYQPFPRSGLITGNYRKTLVYEQDEDRRLVRLHMHQLVFLEALARPKGADSDDAKAEPAHSATGHLVQRIVPAGIYEPVPLQNKPIAQPMPERKRPFSSDSTKNLNKENGQAAAIASQDPTIVEQRPNKTRKVHHNNIVDDAVANTSSTIKIYRGPSALTRSILEYLNNYGGLTFDETASLTNIEFFLTDLPTNEVNNANYANDFPTILSA
ncbi:hypothetical protein NX059_012295 [Plenodomus lindquistii]|nr:hypothetical protein NX059_012295 [Plenodomus lindquistii]